jgi:IS5 family transposase
VKSSGILLKDKRQIAVDGDGLVEGVHTTIANEHDSHGLEPVLKKVPKAKKKEVLTDKGYKVPKNDEYLRKEKIKNRIQHKTYRNRPLTLTTILQHRDQIIHIY